MTDSAASAESGLMFRDSTAAGAMQASLLATPGDGLQFLWRSSTNGTNNQTDLTGIGMPTSTDPVWLMLVRYHGTYSAYYATGTSSSQSWTQIGSTEAVSFSNSTYLAGLAVSSATNSTLNTSTMANTYLMATEAAGLPAGWSDGDIGLLVGTFGSATFSSGVFTVNGGGAGILGSSSSDQFNFNSTSVTGSQTLVTRCTSMSDSSDPSAEVGLMFRDSAATGAMEVSVFCRPSTGVTMV